HNPVFTPIIVEIVAAFHDICSGAKMMAGQRAYLLTQRYLNDEACLCITEVKVTHNAVNNLGPTCARTDTLTPSSYCCH
ncbi:TPA: hypothetical protein ACHTMV_004697, partial [Salmonella enterica subsp. enterica serovar Blockley]